MAHPDRPGPLLYLKSDGCPDELSVTLTLHKLWLSTPHSGEALVQPLLPVPLSLLFTSVFISAMSTLSMCLYGFWVSCCT